MLRNGVPIHADGIIPAEVDDNSHEGVPWEFHKDLRHDEYFPRVGLGGSFSGFVEGSLSNELWYDLLI